MKSKARACVAAHGEKAARVFFLHNRKAGGTTVRKWLKEQQICQQRFEGFVEEHLVLNVSRLAEPGTIFVTALREPVSRIISSYKFEGEGTFREWVEKVQDERGGGRYGRIWMEVQNYYVQRLSGYRWRGKGPNWDLREERSEDYPDWSALFDRALLVLHSFDVVFLVDEFNDSAALSHGMANLGVPQHHTQHSRQAEKGANGDSGHGLGHARPQRHTKGPQPTLNLTASEDHLLRAWNEWDLKLFAAAKARAEAEKRNTTARVTPARLPKPPPLSECAVGIKDKWSEPLSRLRRHLSCHHH